MKKTSTAVSARATIEQKNYVTENTRHAISYRSLSHYLAGVGPSGPQVEGVQCHPSNASWPSIDIMRTMPFDYSIHDPRYDDVSPVYSPGCKPSAEGTKNFKHHLTSSQQRLHFSPLFTCKNALWLYLKANAVRQEDVYLRRRTSRMKLSKYAAYNTYHHCEQCHQYLGFNPRYQVSEKKKTNRRKSEKRNSRSFAI